uniref:Uncharacterized protein n=1 Tax=Ralstonia syzygii R24 TaxID=907261 RepID=G3AAY2_9RALS|nr:hypothetical protein RALSY_mp30519 [Ralstonia syzygii R24]
MLSQSPKQCGADECFLDLHIAIQISRLNANRLLCSREKPHPHFAKRFERALRKFEDSLPKTN